MLGGDSAQGTLGPPGSFGSVSVVGHQCQAGNTVLMEAAELFWYKTGALSPNTTNVLAAEGHTLLARLKDSPWVLDQFFTSLLDSWHPTSNKSGILGSGQSPVHPRRDTGSASLLPSQLL